LSGGYYVSGENRRRFGEKRLEGEIRYSTARPESRLPDQVGKGEPVSQGEPEEFTVKVQTCAARRMGLA
jgi:hypothetical protein